MRRKAGTIGELPQGTDREFVQVVARAFDVLRCFEGVDRILGNGDIAQRTGLPPSTVSRLTYTLSCTGHLSYLAAMRRYRLGNGAIAMSSALLHGLDLRGAVRPAMQALADRVPGTVGLTVRDRCDMVFLEYARAPHAVGLFSTVGTRVSLLDSAAGRAYVAALPEAARAGLLAELQPALPAAVDRLRGWLPGGLAQLAQDGFAVSCGDWNPHINGVAVPLAQPATPGTAVLGIGVLASVYDADRLRAEVAPLLLATSRGVAGLLRSTDAEPSHPNRSASP